MKTKKFRVAKAGQTTDGRAIPLEHIKQMASSYNPATYGARINIEHIKSYSPDSAFRSYGDVVSLEIEEEGDDTYLVAEVDPTDDLVALSVARQKVYFSIEYNPNFADSGAAYLSGLACTDSPASLGTSYMTFCQQHPEDNPLAGRKTQPNNVISTAEFSTSFEPEAPKPVSLFNTVQNLFTTGKTEAEQNSEQKALEMAATIRELPTALFNMQSALLEMAKTSDETNQRIETLLAKQNTQDQSLSQINTVLDTTPDANYHARPPATGGAAEYMKTDC